MKTKIEIISRTGDILFSRCTIGNSIKATFIAAIKNGITLPSNCVFVS